MNQPSASRAVARACATNPVALVTPCHRVVGADGSLSGYRWGVARKSELLKQEQVKKQAGEKFMNFRVIAVPPDIVRQTRETMKSPQYGHPAHADLANGYGPCRSCLRTFNRHKETRILFTYNAFAGLSNLPLPSPVFIHQNECERYEANEFPHDLRSLPIVLEGYGRESWLVEREKVADKDFESVINRLFADGAVDYIHIQNAEAGCFIARIERLGKN